MLAGFYREQIKREPSHICILVDNNQHQLATADQVSVEHPVGMQVVYSIQDLVEQRLHHALGYLYSRLLPCFDSPMILDDVLGGQRENHMHQSIEPCSWVPMISNKVKQARV